MSTIDPLAGSAVSGAKGNGDAHQQRWLQGLERAWLRSWQQAEPQVQGVVSPSAETVAARSERVGFAGPLQPGAIRTGPDATASEAVFTCSDAIRSKLDRTAVLATPRSTSGDASPAATPHLERAMVHGSNAAPACCSAAWSIRTALHRPPAAPGTAPVAPPTGQSAAALHLHESGSEKVVAALRDSRLDAAASRATAESLARQLALAGYAQVQVYVNGAASRRGPNEPRQPPSAVPSMEKPTHGH